jgi:hypothetical protein
MARPEKNSVFFTWVLALYEKKDMDILQPSTQGSDLTNIM